MVRAGVEWLSAELWKQGSAMVTTWEDMKGLHGSWAEGTISPVCPRGRVVEGAHPQWLRGMQSRGLWANKWEAHILSLRSLGDAGGDVWSSGYCSDWARKSLSSSRTSIPVIQHNVCVSASVWGFLNPNTKVADSFFIEDENNALVFKCFFINIYFILYSLSPFQK